MAKRGVARVTVVDLKDSSAQTLFEDKGSKKKRVSDWMRPGERIIRQTIKAQERCWAEALGRHDKSRTKKRDRWLTDGLNNSLRALDKGCRVWGRI